MSDPTDNVGVRTVRCASHRARERLFSALGRKPQNWVSLSEPQCYGVYEVADDDEMRKAVAVKGITKHRPKNPDSWMWPI